MWNRDYTPVYYKNKRDITEHFSCEGNIVNCIASTFQREPMRY